MTEVLARVVWRVIEWLAGGDDWSKRGLICRLGLHDWGPREKGNVLPDSRNCQRCRKQEWLGHSE